MKKSVIIVITICIVASLIAFIQATDFAKVAGSIQQVGYRFIVLLFITFIAYLFGTVSWQYCLGKDAELISTGRLFLILHIGETISLFNPASIVGGDAFKAFMLRDYDIANKTVVLSVLFSRIILIFTQLVLFAFAAVMLILQDSNYTMDFNSSEIINVLLIILVLSGGLLAFYYRLENHVFRWKSGNYIQQKTLALRLKIKEILAEIPFLLKQNKKMLWLSCCFAMLHWISGSLEFYFILKFLGIKVSILQALIVDMGVIFFKAAGAFIPGQIGVEEYGNKIMLMAVGIPGTEIWVTASILRRARQMVWVIFGVGIYFLMFKKSSVRLQE